MTYEDLLIVPYKEKGRDENGMDCYGYVLALLRRDRKYLADLAYTKNISEEQLYNIVCSLGAIEHDRPAQGFVAQWTWAGKLHIGYMVNKKTVTHMTFSGVQVQPIESIDGARFFEVPDASN